MARLNARTRCAVCLTSTSRQTLLASVLTAVCCHGVLAQVVLNIPPDPDIPDNGSVGSNTTVNLHNGGMIGESFDAGNPNGTSLNVTVHVMGGTAGDQFNANGGSEINISGGVVGDAFAANGGSTVNVSGGRVGDLFAANANATVNISGGQVGNDLVAAGSLVNITGGSVGNDYLALTNSSLQMSGGTLGFFLNAGAADGTSTNVDVFVSGGVLGPGIEVNAGAVVEFVGGRIRTSSSFGIDWNIGSLGHVRGGIVDTAFDTFTGADVNIYGNDFFLDDNPLPVAGPTPVTIPSGQILSGILADGTPFALGEPLLDDTQPNTLTLHPAVLPPSGATVINVPPDVAPPSIRGGQTLNLFSGGELPDSFRAGPGSVVNITAGTARSGMEVRGATMAVSGGSVGGDFVALFGSEVNITGGQIGPFATIIDSVVNLSGGRFGDASQITGMSVINVSGGVLGDVFGLGLGNGSEANLSGGIIHDLSAGAGTSVSITGGEFLLDGQVVAGLNGPGDSVAVNYAAAERLTGVFADGTPFAFAKSNGSFNPSSLTLNLVALPAIGPATIDLPGDAAPQGIRQGQTLTLGPGASIGAGFGGTADFVAGPGSTVNVDGGEFGSLLKAVNATVNLNSGSIGSEADLLDGAVLNMSGGALGHSFQVHAGSVANVSGGTIENFSSFLPSVEAFSGATINVTGGSIGQGAILRGAEMNVSGGSVGTRLFASSSGSSTHAVINVSGGTFEGSVQASIGSEFHLLGTEFFIDGVEIPGLIVDEPFTVADRDVTLSGVLRDGSPFSFDLNTQIGFDQDFFHATESTVTVTLIEPSPFATDLDNDYDVDGRDYLLVQRNDPGLIAQWEADFGQTAASSEAAVVPEPATLLLLCGLLPRAIRRRSRVRNDRFAQFVPTKVPVGALAVG